MAHPGLPHSDPLWYKDAVIYELHVRAFYDSNGDGIGDFPGLTQKLDYLQGLGITALWLLPFYPSPRRDDGYDVADYQNVHPAYGTLGDECHMAYHFPLVPRLFLALDQEDRTPITDMLQQTPTLPYNYQWALFLRNHDAVDTMLIVANVSSQHQQVELDLTPYTGMIPRAMLREREFPPIGTGPYVLTLGPYACSWFLLQIAA